MSLLRWLVGDVVPRAVLDVVREENARLRLEIGEQRETWLRLYKGLEASNARLREELVTLADAGAMAQVEAYRERRRAPLPMPPLADLDKNGQTQPTNGHPADIATAVNLQDAYAAGMDVTGPPSEADEELEKQAAAREGARFRQFEREMASMDRPREE